MRGRPSGAIAWKARSSGNARAAADGAAGQSEQQALGEREPCETGAGGSQCGADSDLAIAADGAASRRLAILAQAIRSTARTAPSRAKRSGAGVAHLAVAQRAYAQGDFLAESGGTSFEHAREVGL